MEKVIDQIADYLAATSKIDTAELTRDDFELISA